MSAFFTNNLFWLFKTENWSLNSERSRKLLKFFPPKKQKKTKRHCIKFFSVPDTLSWLFNYIDFPSYSSKLWKRYKLLLFFYVSRRKGCWIFSVWGVNGFAMRKGLPVAWKGLRVGKSCDYLQCQITNIFSKRFGYLRVPKIFTCKNAFKGELIIPKLLRIRWKWGVIF